MIITLQKEIFILKKIFPINLPFWIYEICIARIIFLYRIRLPFFVNYFLNPAQKENLDNRFYGKIVPYFVPDTTFELTDTIIKGENFKRVQLNFHKEDYAHSFIYYLSCNSYKTKFHINTELDEKYPHCQSVKEEAIVANGPHSMKEFSLLEDKLSEKMNKIFFTWEQNAKNTKMPLLNFNDANIQCDLPLRDSLFNPK